MRHVLFPQQILRRGFKENRINYCQGPKLYQTGIFACGQPSHFLQTITEELFYVCSFNNSIIIVILLKRLTCLSVIVSDQIKFSTFA